MTTEGRPTRAEVSDAANAVDDGVDAIMLAGETASGAFPARAVQTLDAIIRDAEADRPQAGPLVFKDAADHDHAQAICEAAVTLAERGDAQAIIAVTRGGKTARRLSALRPRVPILAMTDRVEMARRLSLYWGVFPVASTHRAQGGFGRHAHRASARRARPRAGRRARRARQHQPRSRPRRRQLPQDSATLMPTVRPSTGSLTHALKAVIIVIGAAIVVRAARLVIARLEHRLGHGHSERDLEWQRRASTLGGILTRLVTVTVWFVAVLMLLRELSIDVLPILTGAGIAGLAIGFGAQNLVRDVISGFFLILEDQVRVGDMARINGVTGVIEQVNLRTIVLRDGEGAVHVFPNGTVTALANLSKQFSNAIVDVRVSYSENLDRVFDAIREVGASMQEDPEWAPLLLVADRDRRRRIDCRRIRDWCARNSRRSRSTRARSPTNCGGD